MIGIGVKRTSGGGGPIISALSSTTVLGDSIAAFGFTSSGGTGSWSNSHISWASDLIAQGDDGVGFDVVSMLAVGGVSLQTIITNQLPTALTDGTEIAWLHGGVNDLNAAIGNSPVSSILSKFTTIISQLSAVKKIVIVDAITPVYQSGITGAKDRAFMIPTINAALEALCSQYANVLFNDVYSAIVDPTSVTLDALAGTLDATDGIHPNTAGHQLMGYQTVKNLNNRIRLSGYKTKGANLLPAFSGSGGTVTAGSGSITGTPPAGWNVALTSGIAGQSIAISALSADIIRLVCANTSASQMVVNLKLISALTAALSIGDLVQGQVGYQASGLSGVNRLGMALVVNNGTGGFVQYGMSNSSNEDTYTYPTKAHGGRRRCPPYTVPAAYTNMDFRVAFNLAPTTGTLTLDLYAPELVKLT
jgi:lysophospholipase L1-like esterase